MTAIPATAVEAGEGSDADATAAKSRDMAAFFAAIATLQQETVSRFDETVGRLSGLAMIGAGRNDRRVIMTLQDFDRLQQEFAALGEVIARLGIAVSGLFANHDLSNKLEQDVIAGISIGDLKDRLLQHYRSDGSEPEVLDEAEF
jgi:hypothetical protein